MLQMNKITLIIFIVFCSLLLGFVSAKLNNNDYVVSNIDNKTEITETIDYTSYFDNISKQLKEIKPTCNNTCICEPKYTPLIDIKGCYSSFENILYSNANEKEYRLNNYDCEEFANNGAKRLSEIGWESKSIIVKVNCGRTDLFDSRYCNGLHQIIEVSKIYIEATSGEIIHPDNYKDYGIKLK